MQLEGRSHTADHLKTRPVRELRPWSPGLYLEDMTTAWGMRCAGALCALWLVTCSAVAPAMAQEGQDDVAGREYFERGRAAFDRAEYERALVYFRHAYRLSGRAELHYNIGIAAARLQREEEAVNAFRRYLDETSEPVREAEVRQRIDALERSIAEREATARALEEAAVHAASPAQEPVDGRRLPTSTIIGASTLGAIGAGGVAAMAVGLAKSGTCKDAVSGVCVVERSSTAWTWVYGGLGAAALVGSATWFAIGARRARARRETGLSLSPTGIMVSGTF